MRDKIRVLILVGAAFAILSMLANAPALWASPNMQGTVPLPTLTPTRRPTQAQTQTQRTPTQTSAPGSKSATPRPTVPGELTQTPLPTDLSKPQPTLAPTQAVRVTATPIASFQIPEGQITCAVGRGGVCGESEGLGDISIQFPGDFGTLGTLVSIVPIASSSDIFGSQAVGSRVFVGHAYQITVVDPDGKTIDAFNPPLELNFIYSNADLAKVESNPNRLAVLFYNKATNGWDSDGVSNPSVNDKRRLIRINTTRLGIVALFANPSGGFFQPTAGPQPGLFDGIWQFIKQLFGIK